MHGGSILTAASLCGWCFLVIIGHVLGTKGTGTTTSENLGSKKTWGQQFDMKGPKTQIGGLGSDKRSPLPTSLNDDSEDHCTTSADCAFNGECIKEELYGEGSSSNSGNNHKTNRIDPEAPGVCECFDGWKGNTCEVLDLMPVDPQKVGLVLPNHDSSTWGGSVLYYEGDGLYHMFASEILYNCGLYSWTTNSQVRISKNEK